MNTKRLLDGMPYTPAAATDLKKTFARVRRELEAQKKDKVNVVPMKKVKK